VAKCLRCGGSRFTLSQVARCEVVVDIGRDEVPRRRRVEGEAVDNGYMAVAKCINCKACYHVDDPKQRPIQLLKMAGEDYTTA
jgi:hypothetical protein